MLINSSSSDENEDLLKSQFDPLTINPSHRKGYVDPSVANGIIMPVPGSPDPTVASEGRSGYTFCGRSLSMSNSALSVAINMPNASNSACECGSTAEPMSTTGSTDKISTFNTNTIDRRNTQELICAGASAVCAIDVTRIPYHRTSQIDNEGILNLREHIKDLNDESLEDKPSFTTTTYVSCGRNASLANVQCSATKAPYRPKVNSDSSAIERLASNLNPTRNIDFDDERCLQLFIFVCRCIAFPYNAKNSFDGITRSVKVTPQYTASLRSLFLQESSQEMREDPDRTFQKCLRSYLDNFLNSPLMSRMTECGAYSVLDMHEMFMKESRKVIASTCDTCTDDQLRQVVQLRFQHMLLKRIDEECCHAMYAVVTQSHQQPIAHGFLKNEYPLNRNKTFEMFRQILGIKKHHFLTIKKLAQLSNTDEQSAHARRELDKRYRQLKQLDTDRAWQSKLAIKEMGDTYINEIRESIDLAVRNFQELPLYQNSWSSPWSHSNINSDKDECTSPTRISFEPIGVSKAWQIISLKVEVAVHQITGLSNIGSHRLFYCLMEVEGASKLCTDKVPESRLRWNSLGEFETCFPLPTMKIRLLAENDKILGIDDKEIAKLQVQLDLDYIRPSWKTTMSSSLRREVEDIIIMLDIRVVKPQTVKMCGWCFAEGRHRWKKWKLRYYVLLQVSQYNFALCSYKPKQKEPVSRLRLIHAIVTYSQSRPESSTHGSDNSGFSFALMLEGDYIHFKAASEAACGEWVEALYRATGQPNKPQPTDGHGDPGIVPDRQVSNMSRLIQNDSTIINHSPYVDELIKKTLEWQLKGPTCSMGWLSGEQFFLIDEYCSRYGVRHFYRQLCYLAHLIDKYDQGYFIDPSLFHYIYVMCSATIEGRRSKTANTVTVEEKNQFNLCQEKLASILEYQITNFRYVFPFGRPEGSLQLCVALLLRLMNPSVIGAKGGEEGEEYLRKCMRNAALINYTELSNDLHIEEILYAQTRVLAEKSITVLIHLCGKCVELLKENKELYHMAFDSNVQLIREYEDTLWSLLTVDIDYFLKTYSPDDCVNAIALYRFLNDYIRENPYLMYGRFHNSIRSSFAPVIVRYLEKGENEMRILAQEAQRPEKWENDSRKAQPGFELINRMDAMKTYVADLEWPDAMFVDHLEQRIAKIYHDCIAEFIDRTFQCFISMFQGAQMSADSFDCYVIPDECCEHINAVQHCRNQVHRLLPRACEVQSTSSGSSSLSRSSGGSWSTCCSSKTLMHGQVDGSGLHQTSVVIDQISFDKALEETLLAMERLIIDSFLDRFRRSLERLRRHDENSLFHNIFVLTKTMLEPDEAYFSFVSLNTDRIRHRIHDELFILTLFEKWYTGQMKMLNDWLCQRISVNLHPSQLTCLFRITKKLKQEFELQGVRQKTVECEAYATIIERLKVERASK